MPISERKKTMKSFVLLGISIVVMLNGISTVAEPFDHTIFDTLLQKHVKNGLVNYRALKANREPLKKYLKQLEQVDPASFEKWTSDEQKAFWINAYNAITIEGILRNYPIQWGGIIARARFPQNSIRQISDFWETVFIKVMERNFTLNHIEHEILRKKFNDPRIHFVIVCASIGCPILENRSFFSNDLDQRLEKATYNFINNRDKVKLDNRNNTLYLSSIFDWYKEDFPALKNSFEGLKKYGKKERNIVAFVIKYLPEVDKKFIFDNQPKIKYLNYDWSLNEQ